jgi:hypothetical protein
MVSELVTRNVNMPYFASWLITISIVPTIYLSLFFNRLVKSTVKVLAK